MLYLLLHVVPSGIAMYPLFCICRHVLHQHGLISVLGFIIAIRHIPHLPQESSFTIIYYNPSELLHARIQR
jgi:hypothetical protein